MGLNVLGYQSHLLQRCTLRPRQPMIEFYFLAFSSFPLRKPEYKFWFCQESISRLRTILLVVICEVTTTLLPVSQNLKHKIHTSKRLSHVLLIYQSHPTFFISYLSEGYTKTSYACDSSRGKIIRVFLNVDRLPSRESISIQSYTMRSAILLFMMMLL